MSAMNAVATAVEDEKAAFQLDVEYQHAVKVHDVATIKRIHADDMILVLGNGTVRTGAELEEKPATHADLREAGRDRRHAQGPCLRRYGRSRRAAMAQGHRSRRCALRLQALVQRYLCSHRRALALRLRAGFLAASEGVKSLAVTK